MKIDTSTTAGKIEVQQGWVDKKEIQYCKNSKNVWKCLMVGHEPNWDWLYTKYRIKPQTAEEAALNGGKKTRRMKIMCDNQKFKKVCSELDYADKPFKRDWRGMALTVVVIAAFLGLVALEYALMGEAFGL